MDELKLKKPDTVSVSYVPGSLGKSEFIAGVPLDGTPVDLPVAVARALIAVGVVKEKNAPNVAQTKEND